MSGSNDLGWQNKVLLVSVLALSSVAYWQGWTPSTLRQLFSAPDLKNDASAPPAKDPVPPPKPVSASSVHMSCRVTPDITDEHGRLYAGEMLKIIDVAAGVAARRHTDLNCVTISVDRVILVREIRSGDVIHVDACINRAWGSSIEAGVRVLLEDEHTGELIYCCHAYLTFVALAPAPASHSGPPPSLRLGNSTVPKVPRRKPTVAAIVPQTLIEKKRYLFAGRRRAMRTTQPPEDFSALRTVVAKMIPTHARRQWAYESGSSSQASSNAGSGRTSPRPNGEGHRLTLAEKRQRHELRSLELELLADAFEAHDPHVHMDDGDIVRADVEVYGPDAPVASLKDLERILEKRKRGRRPTWVGLRPGPPSSFPSDQGTNWAVPAQQTPVLRQALDSPALATLSPSDVFRPRKTVRATSESGPGLDIPRMVDVHDTLACTMQIVMPQHANSVGVLFGGQLMEWMERTAVLAAHRLKRDCAWVTAGMDGLQFREAVATGEVLTFRAIVTHVWTSSVEVYVCSHADVRRPYPPPEGQDPSSGSASRFTNEAFLTLVALTPTLSLVPTPLTSSPTYGHMPHLHEDSVFDEERERQARRRSTMLPVTASPIRIGAAIIEPIGEESDERVLAATMRGAEKRRTERLETREVLLRVYASTVM